MAVPAKVCPQNLLHFLFCQRPPCPPCTGNAVTARLWKDSFSCERMCFQFVVTPNACGPISSLLFAEGTDIHLSFSKTRSIYLPHPPSEQFRAHVHMAHSSTERTTTLQATRLKDLLACRIEHPPGSRWVGFPSSLDSAHREGKHLTNSRCPPRSATHDRA